ncbi:hypothetical protein BDR22DRAFT_969070 [Usnea florida]
MAPKQTMTWNGEADVKLLLAILKVTNAKPDFDAVAKELTTDVVTCTTRAVQERLKKLRKMVGPVDHNAQTPTKTATTLAQDTRKDAATPTGVKKTGKPAAAGNEKKRKAAVDVSDDGDMIASDDGNIEVFTPSKKRKLQAMVEDSGDLGEEIKA